ncbi:MAG: uridine kinase [Jatrophihabitantaceae bacterium]
MTQARAIAEIARLVDRRPHRTVFVGIDGPGAAGKSTFAARMAQAVPRAMIVAVDDFSGPRFAEWDWLRFCEQVVTPLKAGDPARYQRWDWDSDAGAEWHELEPGTVVLVEGVSSTRSEVGSPWASRIWVDTPAEVRLERALQRDGQALMSKWVHEWIPSEQRYITAQAPQRHADLIISGIED